MAAKERRINQDDDNIVEFPGDLDPAQFRVSGTDTKGHTERIWINFQPMHVQTMDILSKNGKFPFRNRGDLVRHAVVREFHWLERIHKPVNSVTGALDAMNALLRDAEFRQEFTEYLGKLNKQIEAFVDEGDVPAARKLLLETLRHVETMPEGYWKTKYQKAITEKHKRLLEDLPKASLFRVGDETEDEEAANG
jgi:hypothetical protein